MNLRDLLEEQIIADAIVGDTTVLAELLEQLDDDAIYNALDDENQKKVDECRFICNGCHERHIREDMNFDDENDNDLCNNCKG